MVPGSNPGAGAMKRFNVLKFILPFLFCVIALGLLIAALFDRDFSFSLFYSSNIFNKLPETLTGYVLDWDAISAIAVAITIFVILIQSKATKVLARDSILPKVQVFLCGDHEKPRAYVMNYSNISGYIDIATKVILISKNSKRRFKREVKNQGKEFDYNTENLLGWPERKREVFPGIIPTNLHPHFGALFNNAKDPSDEVKLILKRDKVIITLIIKVTPVRDEDVGIYLEHKKEYVYTRENGRWQWRNHNWGVPENFIVIQLLKKQGMSEEYIKKLFPEDTFLF